MPRWLGSLILVALGLVGVYQAIKDPCVRLRGMLRPLKKWEGRLFYGFYCLVCLGGGIAIWMTR